MTPLNDTARATHSAAVVGYPRKTIRRDAGVPAPALDPAETVQAEAAARRLQTCHLRPTRARLAVLDALTQAAPRCLDTTQLIRLLIPRFERLTPATIYRTLSDLWGAGLLLRVWGQQGRTYYGIKPEQPGSPSDTLSCQCGKQMVVIGDRTLHEHLRSLAGAAGFDTGQESPFAISLACAGCVGSPACP